MMVSKRWPSWPTRSYRSIKRNNWTDKFSESVPDFSGTLFLWLPMDYAKRHKNEAESRKNTIAYSEKWSNFCARYRVTLKDSYTVTQKTKVNPYPMISNTHLIARQQNQPKAIAIAATMQMNISREMQAGQAFQLIPNALDIRWLLENFFLKKLFRAIA